MAIVPGGTSLRQAETTDPFGPALSALLVEHDYATASGKPKWATFAAELEGVYCETLRRAVAGKRRPSPKLIEECARVLRIRATYFLEYRLHLAQQDFDAQHVGLAHAAENLRLWQRARE